MIERFRWMRERDGCRLYTAHTASGELVAGLVTLLSRADQTAYFCRQGSLAEHVAAGILPALYWHTATDLADEFPLTNFGGSLQASLSRFKDHLGARAVLHFQLMRKKMNSKTGSTTSL